MDKAAARNTNWVYSGKCMCRSDALVVLICTLVTAAAAQPLSFSRTEIPVGLSCCSLVTADFNGDGKPDLAVFGYTNTGVGSGGPPAAYILLQ